MRQKHQDTPGQHRDASGHRQDTLDGYTDLAETHGWGLQIIFSLRMSACQLRNFISITLQASPWEVVTTGYLDAWMPMAIKRVRSSSLARYNVDDTNLAQLQLLLLEMERQLLIISAMIDRLRSRWGLPGGLHVIRQRRHRRYRFRPWPTRPEPEEEGQ